MAVFKCKMCGGALEIQNNETVAVCEYCGTKQTLPKLDDERKATLIDRANHFRRNNEFDKAAGIYEQILSEDNTDAESYWSLVLCRYGIEYVEDPKTRKRVPTVNRAQYSSIFADKDYKEALKYADGYQTEIYEQEAAAIDEIQKGILEISQKEEPFDVFICYKETDFNGRRTPDSVYAQDIYKALTEEGYKVFFARITLEDKLGSAYEPYIFAALNSAKVMLVVGTQAEHFNAVWVKNEWSRYLALINAGKKKTLIPVYKDMDPYELPEEFAYIQSQDMSKIGFMQDLVRGIQKIIPKKAPTVASGSVENQIVDSMISKAFNFMSSGDFKSATLCLDTVHAYDANNAMYYVGQLMMEHSCTEIEKIAEIKTSILENEHYINAVNNADDELKEKLRSYGEHTLYNEALVISNDKKEISDFEQGLALLDIINVDSLLISDADFATKVKDLKAKLEKQKADKQEQERKQAEAKAKKKKRIKTFSIISTATVCVVVAFVILLNSVIIPNSKYNKAMEFIENGEFVQAYDLFGELGDYKDSLEKRNTYRFSRTKEILQNCEVGDEVILGAYEQDNNDSNGKEDIEWLVLEVKGTKALVMSKYALECKGYDETGMEVYWENCSLRKWLNEDFYKTAFSQQENEIITTSTVSADANPDYNTNQGKQTKDKIFLLSYEEITQHLNDETVKCEPTKYAATKITDLDSFQHCDWWLRTSGHDNQAATVISFDGYFLSMGYHVDFTNIAVRPAMWIDFSNID